MRPIPYVVCVVAQAAAAVAAPQMPSGRPGDEESRRSYAAHIAACDASLRLGELPEARRWLAAAPRAARLLDVEHGGLLLRLRPHEDTLWHLSFSPDGRRFATCSWDGTMWIGDTMPLRERTRGSPVP